MKQKIECCGRKWVFESAGIYEERKLRKFTVAK
jgi:hypothetical protein